MVLVIVYGRIVIVAIHQKSVTVVEFGNCAAVHDEHFVGVGDGRLQPMRDHQNSHLPLGCHLEEVVEYALL